MYMIKNENIKAFILQLNTEMKLISALIKLKHINGMKK